MYSGYYSATAGMATQFHRLDVISNNLANVNTNGFKQDGLVFGDYLRVSQNKRDEMPIKNHTFDSSEFLNRSITRVPIVDEMYTDFKLGKMIATENRLDLAIGQNDMFFLVETPDGGRRLTRDGAFTLSSKGELVTQSGFKVLDKNEESIKLPPNSQITFSEDGKIYSDDAEVTTMFFAQPQNLSELEKVGDNFFVLPNKRDKLKEDITNKIDVYLANTNLNNISNDEKVNVLRILKTEIDGAINETISHTKEIYPETKVELKDSILEALAIELSLLDKFKFETKQKIFNELKPQIEKTVNDMQDKDSMITEIKHSLNCETLRSGFIETSNINMVSEMTNLIETNRLLEMYQKVMSSQNDDMNRDAITKLAPTKG